jgi:hypothetical protein
MIQQYNSWEYLKECMSGYKKGTCIPIFVAAVETVKMPHY